MDVWIWRSLAEVDVRVMSVWADAVDRADSSLVRRIVSCEVSTGSMGDWNVSARARIEGLVAVTLQICTRSVR